MTTTIIKAALLLTLTHVVYGDCDATVLSNGATGVGTCTSNLADTQSCTQELSDSDRSPAGSMFGTNAGCTASTCSGTTMTFGVCKDDDLCEAKGGVLRTLLSSASAMSFVLILVDIDSTLTCSAKSLENNNKRVVVKNNNHGRSVGNWRSNKQEILVVFLVLTLSFTDAADCATSDGSSLNAGDCTCGTSECDATSGLYCVSSLDMCAGEYAPGDGVTLSGSTERLSKLDESKAAAVPTALDEGASSSRNRRVIAWVGCRAGSRRLPGKNTSPFSADGRTLIDIKLDQLAEVPMVDLVVFSSNDPKALGIAWRHMQHGNIRGKLVVVERDDCYIETTSPKSGVPGGCTTSEYLQYVGRVLKGEAKLAEGRLSGADGSPPSVAQWPDGKIRFDAADHVLYTQVTAPLFGSAELAALIEEHLRDPARGTIPVGRLRGYIYDNNGDPLTFDPFNGIGTQNLGKVDYFTFAAAMGTRSNLEELGYMGKLGVALMPFDIVTVWEINTRTEFIAGQALFAANFSKDLNQAPPD